jgi:hypothetical protein
MNEVTDRLYGFAAWLQGGSSVRAQDLVEIAVWVAVACAVLALVDRKKK